MMKIHTITKSLLPLGNQLGECPSWHPVEHRLYWLDIERGLLFRLDPASMKLETFNLGVQTGSFAFRQDGGLVLATELGLAFWSEAEGTQPDFITLYQPGQGLMMNDGRADRKGNFWAGSKGPAAQAALFRLSPQRGVTRVLGSVSISNGIDWDYDRRLMYYVDSGARTIFRYKFDPDTHQVHSAEVFYTPAPNAGTPDGLCLDAQGNIWCAIWDGSKVIQLAPEGATLQEIHLPVSRPTSITFGGPELKDLYITSASTELSSEEKAHQAQAGDLFVFHTDLAGRPASFFLG